jgi:hypothetical protein
VRNREDHVIMGQREEVFRSPGEPLLAGVGLALWAVPISAGVIRDGLMTTGGATVQMASKGVRAAVADGSQDLQVWPCQMASVVLNEAVACRSNDVGHLERWPVHFLTRFRERFT